MNILIKTYPFDCGLFYLAELIAEQFRSQGHTIQFIPKESYVLRGQKFIRTYANLNHNLPIFSEKESIESQTLQQIKLHKAELLLSFETLMEDSNWIAMVQREIPVVDIPMGDWARKKNLHKYSIFHEVWCLNQAIFDKMPERNRVRPNFHFADTNLFFPESPKKDFVHSGSLSTFSVKNTQEVIEAFIRADIPANLYITGSVIGPEHPRIHYTGFLSREALAAIYRKSLCVIAPSIREGLSLSLYEAQACGAKIITTNAAPMNEVPGFYCEPYQSQEDDKMFPKSFVSIEEIKKKIQEVWLECQD